MSDQSLRGAVMAALAHNQVVHPDEIAVDIRDGDVTLRGTVGSLLHQAEAVRTASGVPGESRGGAVTLSGLVEVPSQRARAQRIAMGGPGVASVHNELRVCDNDVTLNGTVTTAGHHDAAIAAAADAPGVARVHDEPIVRANPS